MGYFGTTPNCVWGGGLYIFIDAMRDSKLLSMQLTLVRILPQNFTTDVSLRNKVVQNTLPLNRYVRAGLGDPRGAAPGDFPVLSIHIPIHRCIDPNTAYACKHVASHIIAPSHVSHFHRWSYF